MLLSRVLIADNTAYSVDVLPDPVGPVTNTAPCGARNAGSRRAELVGGETQARHVDDAPRRVQHAQHHRLAGRGRHGRDADVDGAAFEWWP